MIIIRAAHKGEVHDLQNLNNEVFTDNYQYDSDLIIDWALSTQGKQYFTQLLTNPKACCLFAEDNGKKVGYIAAVPKKVSYRKSKYIEIENMGVVPQYRSKGVGTLLIEHIVHWAKKRGFQKIFVNAYYYNKKAIAFYKKNDFSEIDVSLEKLL